MRLSTLFILVFWLASMSWLVWEKVLPPLLGGQAPDYLHSALRPGPAPPVVWQIQWEERLIGFSVTQPIKRSGGFLELRSVVDFERLPIDEMASQLFGAAGKMLGPLLRSSEMEMGLTFTSQVVLKPDRRLESFHTAVSLAESPPMLRLRGTLLSNGKLLTTAHTGFSSRGSVPVPTSGSPPSPESEIFKREIDLPPDAQIGDMFSPPSELKGLRVGQSWTTPVYRPFPPNSPPRILAAKAERREAIAFDGESVQMTLVVYRDEAGSGLQAARQPIGRLWVRGDGVVLRQEIMLSNLRLTFERLPEGRWPAVVRQVEDERFFQLLSGVAHD